MQRVEEEERDQAQGANRQIKASTKVKQRKSQLFTSKQTKYAANSEKIMSVNTDSLSHSPSLLINELISGINYWLCNEPFTPFKLWLKVKFRYLKINSLFNSTLPNWRPSNFSIFLKHFKDFRIF